MTDDPYDRRNGWAIYLHPAFRRQFDALTAEVDGFRRSLDPKAFAEHPKARLLARVVKLILEDLPRDPASAAYELGNTLGRRIAIGAARSSISVSASSFDIEATRK